MKSLTKNIYTLTVLVAMLLLSCSKEDRYLCSDNDPTPLTTRSVVSLDSLNSGDLVLLEETEELLNKTNKIAFSYLVDTIDEDWILDDYGIRDWVESLPTKSISLATIANSYKIIGL